MANIGQTSSVHELEQQLEELRSHQRAKNDLVEKLIHDMKGPLTVMLIELGMLDRWLDKGSRERASISSGRISDNCEELMAMIQNLLDLERMQKGSQQLREKTMGIGGVLAGVLESPDALLRKRGVSLAPDLRDGDSPVCMDPTVMGRAFQSLIRAAAKLAPQSGAISVRTGREGRRYVIRLGGFDPSHASDDLQALLIPFEHRRWHQCGIDAGTGIGVQFCRHVLERHGGSIHWERNPEEEARIRVDLPIAETDGVGF